MRIAVRYHSKGGNTRKVAEAIAQRAGVAAQPLDAAEKLEGVDLLFIGGGIYAGSPLKALKKALAALTAEQVRSVAFFYTHAEPSSAFDGAFKAALTDPAIAVLDEVYHCKGRFFLMHKGHPDAADLQNAATFAQKTMAAQRASK